MAPDVLALAKFSIAYYTGKEEKERKYLRSGEKNISIEKNSLQFCQVIADKKVRILILE